MSVCGEIEIVVKEITEIQVKLLELKQRLKELKKCGS